MNLSGESTGPLAAYHKLPLNRIIVRYDDMDLPCGVLRVHPKGGHGRHNGWKNVIYHFRGNWEFGRLRIGLHWNRQTAWSNGSQGFSGPKVQQVSPRED